MDFLDLLVRNILREEEDSDVDETEEVLTLPIPNNIHNEIPSLKELCLNTVAHNFGRFNSAFLTSEDGTLLGNISFLRRWHSNEILKKLVPNYIFRTLTDSNIRFLIHEYSYKVDIDFNVISSPEALFERLAEIGHHTLEFHCDTTCQIGTVPTLIDSCLRHLPNITTLCIISEYCTNETLRIISSSCLKLKELIIYLSCTPEIGLSKESWKILCSVEDGVIQPNHSLKKLIFSLDLLFIETRPDYGVPFLLENMVGLEILNHPELPNILYQRYKHDLKNGIEENAKKYNLTYINLFRCPELEPTVCEFLSVCNKVCPHLKKLSTRISDQKELDQIALFPELETLDISVDSEIDLNCFLKLKGNALKKLTLHKCCVSLTVLIENCQNLEVLYLEKVSLQTDKDIRDVCGFQRLRKLKIRNSNRLYEQGIAEPINILLKSCSKLENLIMIGFKFICSEAKTKFSEFCKTSVLQTIRLVLCWFDLSLLSSILLNCSYLKLLHLKYPRNRRERLLLRYALKKWELLKIPSVEITYLEENEQMDYQSETSGDEYGYRTGDY